MSDESKKYSIVGKVEIGTDEYRELIEGKLEAEKDASEYRSKYWAEQSKVSDLNKKVERLNKQLDAWAGFLADHSAVKDDWLRYLATKVTEDDE